VTTLKEIQAVAMREIEKMYQEAEKLGLKEIAPMQFVYYGCSDDMEAEFTLEIAMAVDQEKPYEGKYRFKELEGFTCASTTHKGDINQIGNTYEQFMPELVKSGRQVSDQTREVYLNWVAPDSPENVTEIQIGIN
jgi:effector-binding domain-containing protein